MDKQVKRDCIDKLRKPGNPIVIVAAVREAEAIKYACDDAGINVSAFCDTEKRKSEDLFCGLKVIHTPNLPQYYSKARFVIASQHIQECAEQLTEACQRNGAGSAGDSPRTLPSRGAVVRSTPRVTRR